jgi:hypothetical protein
MLKRLIGGAAAVNISPDALKAMLGGIWQDLKAKKLVPVAALLLVGVVAVPLLLSKSASTPPTLPVAATPLPTVPGLPAVTQRLLLPSQLHGTKRDPFAPQTGAGPGSPLATSVSSSPSVAGSTGSALTGTTTTPATSSGASSPTPGTGASNSGGSSPSTGGNGSGGNGSGGNGSGGNGSGGRTPTPSGLTPRQSYGVKLAVSSSSGGINTIDPLQRLSILPRPQQPLMIELGVLQGGNRVLFALEPGAAVIGPGQCIPGPIDCQLVSLGRNQIEHVGGRNQGRFTSAGMFAVTGISVVTHGSVAAAQRARRDESATGRMLLNRTNSSALSLFRYQPGVGAVVDLRNLTFGVNS